ncbi:hypothetical protein [Latilactobacillus curvatus]|uniref:hypothetical protein n=1 Tax=Latilactobacillus curvatus TaxID=28038 RepID=UPI00155F6FA2|nr:hypothetical protein [Latilactobacillus curvatus]
MLEDFRLAEKTVVTNLHWDLEQYENADSERMNIVLGAKDKKDRAVDPLTLIGKG